MGIVADRLAAMSLRVTSPDGRIEGTYQTTGDVSITFAAGAYGQYRERELERQLARLCMRLWSSYQREYDAVFEAGIAFDPTAQVTPVASLSSRQRRFRQEQAEMVSAGMSPERHVYMESTGLVRWSVVIRDGVLARLDEDEFTQQALGAFRALMADYSAKMSALMTKHYGESYDDE